MHLFRRSNSNNNNTYNNNSISDEEDDFVLVDETVVAPTPTNNNNNNNILPIYQIKQSQLNLDDVGQLPSYSPVAQHVSLVPSVTPLENNNITINNNNNQDIEVVPQIENVVQQQPIRSIIDDAVVDQQPQSLYNSSVERIVVKTQSRSSTQYTSSNSVNIKPYFTRTTNTQAPAYITNSPVQIKLSTPSYVSTSTQLTGPSYLSTNKTSVTYCERY
ncbi:hypothetical protein SAMD00019534_034290 [Acytostelium subglobosum LB1]|uniref:hypothetical protein n=1 Tax=Acytostelium subglobosum LB1 TaxID=1410327 RepID=UPI000645201B|nr:hypothetical protein SAMD00019534_034290 [Acytostelium subglobosum LB1]GAM20254.1 hypothetical protein SAMD00019534_034290 [Acytostelium subglobosum LB1]|eukprot:XP_012759775.1 hypothetical protein SAMD00019534_034290 [Acytostelium subglobosum LB1]